MTIQKTLISAVNKFKSKEATSAHLDVEILMSHVLKKPKSYIHTHIEKQLTSNQATKFNSLVNKRQRGTPIAYLTGNQEFYGLKFSISKDVLIPRPDTEILVEETIKEARFIKQSKNGDKIIIADIGTGSGCIAIALAKYLPFAKIIATDISPKIISLAKKNAKQHKVLKCIKFIAGDLLKPLKKTVPDIIVANLPYLTKNELPNVKHEPQQALYGGKMGMELIERLIMQGSAKKFSKTTFLLEISPNQKKVTDYLVERHFQNKIVLFTRDLGGRERVVKIK